MAWCLIVEFIGLLFGIGITPMAYNRLKLLNADWLQVTITLGPTSGVNKHVFSYKQDNAHIIKNKNKNWHKSDKEQPIKGSIRRQFPLTVMDLLPLRALRTSAVSRSLACRYPVWGHYVSWRHAAAKLRGYRCFSFCCCRRRCCVRSGLGRAECAGPPNSLIHRPWQSRWLKSLFTWVVTVA